MKKIILSFTFLFPVLLSAQTESEIMQLSLAESIKMATCQNLEVRQAELDLMAAKAGRLEALSPGLPHASFEGRFENYLELPVLIIPGEILGQPGTNIPVEFGTKFNVNAAFQLTQLLYNQSYITAQKLTGKFIELAMYNKDIIKEEIGFETAKLYWYILGTKRQVKLMEEATRSMDELIRICRSHLDNGLIMKIDLQKSIVEKNNLMSRQTQIENLLSNQMKMLHFTLNVPDSVEIVLTDSLNLEFYHSHDQKHTGTPAYIRLLDKQLEIAGTKIKMKRQEYLPTLSAFGGYTFQAQREEFDMFKKGGDKWFEIGVVGLNLSIPIFDGLEKKAQINRLRIEKDKLELQKISAASQLDTKYLIASNTLMSCRKQIWTQHENLKLAREIWSVTKSRYQEGLTALSEVIMSGNSVLEAEGLYLQSLIELRLAESELLKISGNINSLIN